MNFDSIHWFELILINQTWLLFLRLVHFFLASILIRYLLIILSINICNKMKHTSSIKFEVTLSTILNSIWKKLFEFLLQIWFFFDEFIRFFFLLRFLAEIHVPPTFVTNLNNIDQKTIPSYILWTPDISIPSTYVSGIFSYLSKMQLFNKLSNLLQHLE